MTKHKVVFRKDSGGVFALFPELPADRYGFLCVTYQQIGQHSGADYAGCIQNSEPATPKEYWELAKELTGLGCDLEIRKRASTGAFQKRRMVAMAERVIA